MSILTTLFSPSDPELVNNAVSPYRAGQVE